MAEFSLLFASLVHSSIWVKESKETRLVWITLLALKDREGIVRSSRVGLADSAKITMKECLEALRVLMAPDPDDTSEVLEGRRIVEIPGVGWKVVNHDRYRFGTEAKREYWRKQKEKERERNRPKRSKPSSGEAAFVKATEDGDRETCDRLTEPPTL